MTHLSTTVRARIDIETKRSAEAVLEAIGMDSSEAIRLFYKQIANRGEFPLELRVPNEVTIAAMNADVEPESFDSFDAVFKSVLGNQNDSDDQIKKSV